MLRALSVFVAGMACCPALVLADPVSSRPAANTAYMQVYGSALPPYGFVDFCDRQPSECAITDNMQTRFHATAERLSELADVNLRVNTTIAPVTDEELYGVAEYWTLPVDSGDCEDYALLKRHILIGKGWPASALLMTVVRDERGDGHAVLTARTAQGDFILDNKSPDIRLWHQTSYRYVMRQSYVDPRMWVALAPVQPGRAAAVTSLNTRR